MVRRRYRLFTFLAILLVVLLYRVLENSWALSNGADSLSSTDNVHTAPVQPPAGGGESALNGAGDGTKKLAQGLLGDEQDLEKALEADSKKASEKPKQDTYKEHTYQEEASKQDALNEDTLKQDTYKDTTLEDSTLKDTLKEETSTSKQDTYSDYSGDSSSKHSSSKGPSKDSDKDSSGKDSATTYPSSKGEKESTQESPETLEIHASNPPTDNHKLDHPESDRQWAAEHWIKPKENFPLPSGDLTGVPTSTPKKTPKIQHQFGTESERAKNTRVYRQGRVKLELERAWSGYRKYAWMHDELSPQSNQYSDPFCGWAATLVDSLDTLWIADMRDEFDEAANAVAEIDFTFTQRSDIPVFETTIRYLGGLISAYDVSGGSKSKYPMLLNKAIQLADILMGIFDTPNRMPVLYYHWRSPHSSEPHRAGIVGIAELATLSMEFTRLAQITNTAKYYDAVNRITDALVEMQKDSRTGIPGLFPEKIDASGCNKTATTLRDSLSKEAQKQMDASDLSTPPQGFEPDSTANKLNARAAIPPPGPDADTSEDLVVDSSIPPLGPAISKEKDEEQTRNNGRTPPLTADGSQSKWDCVPQGLVPAQWGTEMYHVGGSQDSAYEYFPKQYLLLGGLEPKYQQLHEDAVDAISKHLLYRPMIKNSGDWDILVPAKLTKSNGREGPKYTTSYELTHLTCFVGGMYALGGRIFNRPDDIEIAKQLTDGCVWAYQSTTTGLMPEFAHLAACPTLEPCKFNQTRWYELLDPSKEWRDNQVAKWEEAEALKEQSAKDKEKLRQQAREKAMAQSDEAEDTLSTYGSSKNKASSYETAKDTTESTKSGDKSSDDKSFAYLSEEKSSDYKTSDGTSDYKTSEDKVSTDKVSEYGTSEYDTYADKTSKDKASQDKPSEEKSTSYKSSEADSSSEIELKPKDNSEQKFSHLQKRNGIPMPELDTAMNAPKGESGSELPESLKKKLAKDTRWKDEDVPDVKADPEYIAPPPSESPNRRPTTHEEYVENKLEMEQLPPGYTDMISRSYILRPEAIESVWYMYRITGDKEWQDKGWAMFEATIKATRTEFANSAIDDVMAKSPGIKDSMESFWTAETLKYYYLLFSEPDLISLDEWVLNTEAHPFRRPTAASASYAEDSSGSLEEN